jgi:outer membrane lipoprotein SlyB
MKKYIALVLLALVTAGCAGYRPIVDMKGVNEEQYEADLKECQQYAEQVNVAGETAAGAGIGAAFGAAVSAAGRGRVGPGAAVGAVTGLAAGGGRAASGQKHVINRCLAGRGYKVLR